MKIFYRCSDGSEIKLVDGLSRLDFSTLTLSVKEGIIECLNRQQDFSWVSLKKLAKQGVWDAAVTLEGDNSDFVGIQTIANSVQDAAVILKARAELLKNEFVSQEVDNMRTTNGYLRIGYTLQDIEKLSETIEVGDIIFTPANSDWSVYPFELGKIVAKSKHCFTVESLFAEGHKCAFSYVDLILAKGLPVVSNRVTGMNRSVRYFEPVDEASALCTRDLMMNKFKFGGAA